LPSLSPMPGTSIGLKVAKARPGAGLLDQTIPAGKFS